jgi:hypothetical protein
MSHTNFGEHPFPTLGSISTVEGLLVVPEFLSEGEAPGLGFGIEAKP